jgi:uncharacterized protein (AIM24 family)
MVARCDVMLRGSARIERIERNDRAAGAEPPEPAAGPVPVPVLAPVPTPPPVPRDDLEVEQEVQDALRILEHGARSAAGQPANGPAASPSSWTATSSGAIGRHRTGASATPMNGAVAPLAPAAVQVPSAPPPAAVQVPSAPPLAAVQVPSAPPPPVAVVVPAPPAFEPVAAPPPADALAGDLTFCTGRLLRVPVAGEVLVQLGGLLAVEGQVELTPEPKRVRGRTSTEPFGAGRDAMQRARGAGALVFATGGRHFTAVELGGGAAHLRQRALFAFGSGLSFENGRLAAPGAPDIELVRVAGQGTALLGTTGELASLEVSPDRPVRVDAAALVGWEGALTPRLLPLVGAEAEGDAVELSGDGRVLLDPGAVLA